LVSTSDWSAETRVKGQNMTDVRSGKPHGRRGTQREQEAT
jgi:hypothetical protein